MINNYRIILTKTFREELKNIIRYVSSSLQEPSIAKRLGLQIIKTISSLKNFPSRFVKLKECNISNVHRTKYNNYIIVYLINEFNHEVYILHIFHGSQDYLNKL